MTKLISFNFLRDAMHMQLMHHPRMHRRTASNSQYTLPPQFSPQKKAQAVTLSYAQSKAQMDHP